MRHHRSRPAALSAQTPALACALGCLAGHARADLIDDLPAGTGYAAWELCTRTQQSGDDYLRVRWSYTVPKVQPLPYVWDVDYHPGLKVDVRTFVPFITNKRTAVYRKGLGCTLVPPGATEAAVRAQPFKAVTLGTPSAQAWPAGEGPVQTYLNSPTLNQLLARHGDAIFTETSTKPGEKQNALAFLVARDGHLVY